ncbi:DNA gyrase inhibitor YacG [Parvibium lacunae]|uniref:DNA gyrase inhibitor YacG n=1 Tax=Parvibium lacunae TaxID=1888893 RepID=A0A368L262_9BURK|nr:DNA gyrase inhibitor YacG [Parvibium lacunae]RCS57541.1 DNA gyrase inhibitor YacG [Parvibium lacunae]
MKVKCPTCHQTHDWDTRNRYRPFCSERCKQIDLGAWADERYRVAGAPLDENAVSVDEWGQSSSQAH